MLTVELERMSPRPDDRILDVGCGTGRHLGAAAAFEGVVALGVDRSLEDLVRARERLRFHEAAGVCAGRWALAAGDIRHLPFPDARFDRVICCEVLEHVPDDASAVRELVRVLRPGGDLAVSVPRGFPERICWLLSPEYRSAAGGHVRIYRRRGIVELLRSHGLELRAVRHAHALHTPYWWIRCIPGGGRVADAVHRFLVWDLMNRPKVTRVLESLLDPLFGKSLVLYLRKRIRPDG